MSLDPELFDVPFIFRSRPSPLSGAVRPAWRIALVTLLVNKCRGQRASFEQLHVLNWATQVSGARETLVGLLSGDARNPAEAIVRFDPALNRAIDLGRGSGFFEWHAGKWLHLTPRGKALLAIVENHPTLFESERSFLNKISGKVSHARIEALLATTRG